MKIIVEANETVTGCQLSIEMNGKLQAHYLPDVIHQFLKGVSSNGRDARLAVAQGIQDYIDENLEGVE